MLCTRVQQEWNESTGDPEDEARMQALVGESRSQGSGYTEAEDVQSRASLVPASITYDLSPYESLTHHPSMAGCP